MTHPYALVDPGLSELEDTDVLNLADRRRAHPETWAWDAADELEAILCRTCGTITLVHEAVDELPCPEHLERDEEHTGGRCGSLDTLRVIATDDPAAPRWSPWRYVVVRPHDEAIRR